MESTPNKRSNQIWSMEKRTTSEIENDLASNWSFSQSSYLKTHDRLHLLPLHDAVVHAHGNGQWYNHPRLGGDKTSWGGFRIRHVHLSWLSIWTMNEQLLNDPTTLNERLANRLRKMLINCQVKQGSQKAKLIECGFMQGFLASWEDAPLPWLLICLISGRSVLDWFLNEEAGSSPMCLSLL